MIQLNKDPGLAKEYAKLILADKGNYVSPKTHLDKKIITSNGVEKKIYKYFSDNIEKILISEPVALQEINEEIKSFDYLKHIYDSKKTKLTSLGLILEDLFGYGRFRDSAKAVWLSEKLKIKSCVYCNTQYGLTVRHGKKTKLLFHLDHYFPKKVFPYLSISFYNLIPCCSSCNMSKTNKVYTLNDNIHPYEESVHNIAKYKIDHGSMLRYLLNFDESEIKVKLELRKKYLGNNNFQEKLNHFKEEFKLEIQYEQFSDIAAELTLRSLYYNTSRKRELVELFNKSHKIKLDEELINRFITGNYTEDKNLLNRPLAKFMKDLSEQIKLI